MSLLFPFHLTRLWSAYILVKSLHSFILIEVVILVFYFAVLIDGLNGALG